jgi:hypothetical protein
VIGLVVLVVAASVVYFSFQRTSQLVAIPNLPYKGYLALDDPLQDNSHGYSWYERTDGGGSCAFTGGAYMLVSNTALRFCSANTTFSNFVYQVQITTIKGDYGGIFFRSDTINANFYSFRIGQDGFYELDTFQNNKFLQKLVAGFSNSINVGLGQENLLAVAANGSIITLYVNNVQIASVNDSTYSQGQIGVVADNEGNLTEVEFRDAKVWTL